MKDEREKTQSLQFVKWIFQVLYSPMKTFEEIEKNPNVKGPILILLITLPLTLSVQYTSGAKFFLEIPAPENDLWTEKPSNLSSFLWNSNGNITFDNNDHISGNHSVSTSSVNSSNIWLRLTNIGSFNCSNEEYSRLSFRIKWVNKANVTPTAILQLFSLNNDTSRVELDINPSIANKTNIWTNITFSLVTNNWTTPENSPSWDNITGIGFQLVWTNAANLTLKIDDLFFGKYIPVSSSRTFYMQLAVSLMRSGVDFLLEWLILSGIVLLAFKSFSEWNGFWKNLFFTIGYVYSASLVYLGTLTVLLLLLPSIFLPYSITYLEYIDIYQASWGTPISILSLLFYGWTIILCTVALKKMHEISWNKTFMISLGAVILSLLFSSFFFSAFL